MLWKHSFYSFAKPVCSSVDEIFTLGRNLMLSNSSEESMKHWLFFLLLKGELGAHFILLQYLIHLLHVAFCLLTCFIVCQILLPFPWFSLATLLPFSKFILRFNYKSFFASSLSELGTHPISWRPTFGTSDLIFLISSSVSSCSLSFLASSTAVYFFLPQKLT